MANNENGKHRYKVRDREELNFGRIVNILNRRKYILFGSILVTLLLVVLYNTITPPIYESTAVLKKEKTEKAKPEDGLSEIINLKTQDETETEIELVKTWEVLSKVIEELDLYLVVEKVVERDGNTIEINKRLVDYNLENFEGNTGNPKLPRFLESQLIPSDNSYRLYITKSIDNRFELYNADNDKMISAATDASAAQFKTGNLNMTLYWSDVAPGSRVYFTIASFYDVMNKLKSDVTVGQRLKTDVFSISVKSGSPYSAKLIANTITEKFRQTRIDQQKQTIRYSYDFVDGNLEEVKQKLEEAENNLSQYKASHNIVDLQESSEDIVRFISSLEAEKLTNDLQLTEYKNKLSGMQAEMKTDEYFDQSYLGSQGSNDPGNSPFSTMMKQLSELELRRLELMQKRTENHPEVQKIDEQIATAKKKLSKYNENTLTSYEIISNSLEKKSNQISSLLNRYENKMRTLPSQETQLASLTREKNVFAKMYTLLLDKREEMRIAELSKLQDIVVVDTAHAALDPVSPRKLFNLGAGILFGVVFGFILIFFVEVKNRKLVSLDDIENDFRLPIFALIPNYDKDLQKKVDNAFEYEDRFVTLMDDQDGFKETYRVLRTKLSSAFEFDKKVLMFTSCEENTGKTSVVANLAISIAQAKKKVLVVDCDLKKGALSKAFDIPKDAPGLITYLKKNVDAPYIYNKVVRTLDILPAGGISENSSDLLATERMKNLLNTINTSSYDYILFDTPPITRVVDALVLGKTIKDAVLILRPDHSYKDSIAWGLQELEQAKITVHGTVINAAEIEKSTFKHRYGYGYGYKYSDNYYANTGSNGNGHTHHHDKPVKQKKVANNV
ncbi:MAG: polysaccharide biosynthesis tyrosine autokinase [Ignavibacteriaceae bacterium]